MDVLLFVLLLALGIVACPLVLRSLRVIETHLERNRALAKRALIEAETDLEKAARMRALAQRSVQVRSERKRKDEDDKDDEDDEDDEFEVSPFVVGIAQAAGIDLKRALAGDSAELAKLSTLKLPGGGGAVEPGASPTGGLFS